MLHQNLLLCFTEISLFKTQFLPLFALTMSQRNRTADISFETTQSLLQPSVDKYTSLCSSPVRIRSWGSRVSAVSMSFTDSLNKIKLSCRALRRLFHPTSTFRLTKNCATTQTLNVNEKRNSAKNGTSLENAPHQNFSIFAT